MGVNRTNVFEAGTDNAAGADIDIGEFPGKIDFGEGDAPFAIERSDLEEDLRHQMLAFYPPRRPRPYGRSRRRRSIVAEGG